MNAQDTFFTVVGCMDGRVQEPVSKFGQRFFHASFPDTITEAGLVGILAKEPVDQSLIKNIQFKIDISCSKHHSKGIIVHGHEDCAGNPVPLDQHKRDTLKTTEIIKEFCGEDTAVIPVFVTKNTSEWIVNRL